MNYFKENRTNLFRENRTLNITAQQAANRLAAGLGNEEENRKIIAESGTSPIAEYDAWKAGGGDYAGGYAGYEAESKVPSTGGSFNAAGTEVGAGKGQYASAEEAAAARRAADIASGKITTGTPLPEAQSALDVAGEAGADITSAYLNTSPIDDLANTIAQMKDAEAQAELKATETKSVIAEQLKAAKAAAATRFAESAEGVQTSTSAGLVTRATEGAERTAESALDTINSGLDTLKQLNAQAAEAGVKGEVARQEAIVKQAAAVQKQLEAAQAEYEASGAKATEDVLALFDNMDAAQLEMLSGLSTDAFTQTIQAINPQISGLRAAGLQALAKTLATMDETSPDYQKKQLEVQKLQAELSGTLPQAPIAAEKLSNFLDKQVAAGKMTQAEASAALQEELGIREEVLSPIDQQIKQAELNYKNAQTAAQRATARKTLDGLTEYKAYSDTNVDVVGKLSSLGESMKIDDVYAAAGISRTGGQEFYGQCAAFVNDMLGSSSKYGSSLESKKININNYNPLNPTPGSVFVSTIGAAGIGHVGFVEDVDYENQTATIYDVNRMGGSQGSRRTVSFDELVSPTGEGVIGYENLAMTAKEGVLSASQQLEAAKISAEIFGKAGGASSKPENLSKVENLMKEGLSADDIRDQLRMGEQSEEFAGTIRDAAESIAINLPSGKGETFFNSLDRMLADGNIQGAKEQIKRAARSSAGVDEAKIVAGSERTLEFIGEISDDLKAFAEKGGDTGIFTGTTEKMINKIGRTTDPDLAKVATKIAKAIQSYRRSMSGVAFSVPESEEYKGIFPSIDKIDEFNIAKIEALNEIMQGDVDFFYKNAMGASAYKDIFEGGALDKAPKPVDFDSLYIEAETETPQSFNSFFDTL